MPKAIDNPEDQAKEQVKEQVKAASDTSAVTPEVPKDQARPSDPEKAAPAKPAVVATPKRTAQIAVFVSKKDGKLYVRQNFAPLFDVPVTIAPSDRPLGTHVFTAQGRQGRRQSECTGPWSRCHSWRARHGWTTTTAPRGAAGRPARSK